jgi:rare lipoprotein A
MKTLVLAAATALLLGACASAPKRPPLSSYPATVAPPSAAADLAPDPCAPTRVHRDSDYTAGGLYAPGVSDSGPSAPIDVSGLVEPVPRDEPRSRYGNRSPYTVLGKNYTVLDSAQGYVERGVASWYGTKFNGRATSSSEIYDICAFTAAHKTLPLPSFVRVTNLDNGRTVIVRVNDRGPFHSGRIIDLSYAAAVRLGVDKTGTARVEVRAIVGGQESTGAAPVVSTPAFAPPMSRPLPPSTSPVDGARVVQVGSFADKDNARRLADRLDDAGIDDVDLDKAEVNGRDLWRVRIGPVNADALPALFDRLRELGVTGARLFSE